jgi:hypothetical protein
MNVNGLNGRGTHPPPGILYRFQNKGVTEFDGWKLLKTKGRQRGKRAKQKGEGRKGKAECRKQKAEGRKQRAERIEKPEAEGTRDARRGWDRKFTTHAITYFIFCQVLL